ncbi:MAG TPA: TonB-dependent receptor, partial [Gemmatimonadales bacterium]|nr:TonB-dependent receptor [Gemmatimonadales bacterium]
MKPIRQLCQLAGLALLAGLSAGGRLCAQTPATVEGTLRSQSGTPLAGVRVLLDSAGPPAQTDASGRFTLSVPAHHSARLDFSAVGFSPATLAVPALAPGAVHTIAITLVPLYQLDALTITSRKPLPLLNTRDAATGGTLEQEELLALPTDARDPLTLAYTIPGITPATGFFGDAPPLSINGANSLYTQYTLDGLDNNEGFLGGPRVEFPLGALARLSVLANSYGAELGRSSSGVVEETSRAGSNQSHGDLFGYWRPGIPLDAEPKLTPPGTDPDGFRRFQLGGGASGAIVRDHTFYSVAAEYSNENEDRIGSTAQTQFIGTEKREKVKLFGRIDQGWSPTQTTTLRVAYSNVNRAGQGTGVVTPEADITTQRIGSLTALTHRSAFADGRASNSASVQFGTFRWNLPPTERNLDQPQVTIVAPDGTTVEAVVGSSNFIFDETEHQLQLRDVIEAQLSPHHTLRAGADAIRG